MLLIHHKIDRTSENLMKSVEPPGNTSAAWRDTVSTAEVSQPHWTNCNQQ